MSAIDNQTVINSIIAMNAAITNIKLYPASSAIVRNCVDKAYESFLSLLEEKESISFIESEKSLLIDGLPLSQKDSLKPQVISLLDLMNAFNIRSVSFSKGLYKDELHTFLELISKRVEEVEAEGGLHQIIFDQHLSHIVVDQKIYVVLDKNFQISNVDVLDTISKGGAGRGTSGQEIGSSGTVTSRLNTSFPSDSNRDNEAKEYSGDSPNMYSDSKGSNDSREYKSQGSQGHGSTHTSPSGSDLPYNSIVVKILKAGAKSLENKKVTSNLPNIVDHLLGTNEIKLLKDVLDLLINGLLNGKSEVRNEVSQILARVIPRIEVKLSPEQYLDTMLYIFPSLLKWIHDESNFSMPYEQICLRLQNFARILISNSMFDEGNQIIEAFDALSLSKIEKSDMFKKLAAQVLKGIAIEKVLDAIVNEIQTNAHHKRQEAIRTELFLGGKSVDRLLNILRDSSDMNERLKILKVISDIEPPPSILVERIEEGGSWYYVRNLVLLLGKVGNEGYLQVLQPLLEHADFRVQQEALNSIYNIAGKYKTDTLLPLIIKVDDKLKIKIVDMLGNLKDKRCVMPFIEILKLKSFVTSKDRNKLEEQICFALGKIGDSSAISELSAIADQRGMFTMKRYSATVKAAAQSAIEMIKNPQTEVEEIEPTDEIEAPPDNVEISNNDVKEELTKKEPSPKISETKIPDEPQKTITEKQLPIKKQIKKVAPKKSEGLEKEALIDKYISQNKKEEALKLLFELIVQNAREKKFTKAEQLREKLIELDPMALSEIIKTAEIIDSEKSEGITKDYLELWDNLYSNFSTEEANELYYSMEDIEYEAGETVFTQEELSSNLYFINHGEAKIIFRQNDKEILIKKLKAGDIAGDDTFFNASMCTSSMVAITNIKLGYLNKNILLKWRKKFPSLEKKLINYCLKFDSTPDLLKQIGENRRTQKRVKLSGAVNVQLLNSSGQAMGKPFKGEIADLSIGGMSFFIKTSNQDTASLLLGRNAQVKFNLPKGLSLDKISKSATIIGVRYLLLIDYSIHMKFDQLLNEKIINEIEEIKID
ncbi:MAG: cyclic nucleotide-binding domain-containing protein [Desulfobacterales bacterium]|nr:cyclic nucleotide-binding domain-containing protein [Desulfobacterales bacterium]